MQIVGTSIRMGFGVFIQPLEDQFGWSQNGLGFAYALSSIVSAVVSPVTGNLGDRFGAKKSMLIGAAKYKTMTALNVKTNKNWIGKPYTRILNFA